MQVTNELSVLDKSGLYYCNFYLFSIHFHLYPSLTTCVNITQKESKQSVFFGDFLKSSSDGVRFGFAFGPGRFFAGDYPNRLVIANESAGD